MFFIYRYYLNYLNDDYSLSNEQVLLDIDPNDYIVDYYQIEDGFIIIGNIRIYKCTLNSNNINITTFDRDISSVSGSSLANNKIITYTSDLYSVDVASYLINSSGNSLHNINYRYDSSETNNYKITVEDVTCDKNENYAILLSFISNSTKVKTTYTTIDKFNPKTYDDIMKYVIIGTISIVIIGLSTILIIKNKKN